MIKTFFYTFFPTKHQEENADPTDPNYPLFPQEIEIRPITYFSWIVHKTLTTCEIICKLELPMEHIQDILLRGASQDDISRLNVEICETRIVIKDVDTNTFHNVTLWKYPHEVNFSMRESWIEEFVKRRELVEGMVVGIYWDVDTSMFCFSVLERS